MKENLTNAWSDKQLTPMKTPLMAYGFDSTSMEYFKSKVPQYNYETYGTASSSSDDIAKPLGAGWICISFVG